MLPAAVAGPRHRQPLEISSCAYFLFCDGYSGPPAAGSLLFDAAESIRSLHWHSGKVMTDHDGEGVEFAKNPDSESLALKSFP